MSTPAGSQEPHRGQLIMVLGVISLIVAGVVLGPIAWIMGNRDLKKMAAGQMDRAGEPNTRVGRLLGKIATFVHIVGCGLVGTSMFLFMLGLYLPAMEEMKRQQRRQQQAFPTATAPVQEGPAPEGP